ncbi:MAG: phosphatase PAP2 family protein [Cytophagaceae bacterium]
MNRNLAVLFIFCISLSGQAISQTDSANTAAIISQSGKTGTKWYKTRVFKAFAVPTVLIGYGVSCIQNHGFYSSYQLHADMRKNISFKRTHIDDYLIYAPYAELILLNAFKVKCKNDFINTALLTVKTELFMVALTFPVKHLTHIQRPDSANPGRYMSFPSGHTAQSFAAASIVHKEFKHKSVWYGVGAYTIATSVGVFRMLNNRHWESDVFAGAGFGILSAHLAYLTHRNRWGRKCDLSLIPMYNRGCSGLAMSMKF